jgi:prepilin signal peptidase PulO-like enzyme (type II secretory pathway)
MTPDLILGALAAALLAGALLPALTWLPARIERQWREELQAFSQAGEPPPLVAPTRPERALFVGLGLLLGLLVTKHFGPTLSAAAWAGYLLLLAAVNSRSTMLPDMVVLPTLWAGLLWHARAGEAEGFIYGAVVAYLVPWLLETLLRLKTGRWLIGQGDMKAFAMAGAWVGLAEVGHLFGYFLLALAVEVGLLLVIRKGAGGIHPTGPAHLFASLAVVFGPAW